MNAAIKGIVVIMSPAKLLAVVLSASVMRYQGPTISRAANNRTPRQFFRVSRRSPRKITMGSRITAPIVTRNHTMLGVLYE
jgi:hypothetical protein